MLFTVQIKHYFLHVETAGDLQRSPKVRELPPLALQLSVGGVRDLRPDAASSHVYKEAFADTGRPNARRVERPHLALTDHVPRLVGVLWHGQGRREIVAGPGRQEGERHALREPGLTEPVDDLVDGPVAPGDYE